MASRKPTGARSETVKCPNCGEYYAVTYRRCPFCEERDRRSKKEKEAEDGQLFDETYDEGDYEEETPIRTGGKRLVTNRRGGGYGRAISPIKVVGTILSLALIIAAIWIVVSIIRPLIEGGAGGSTVGSQVPGASESLTPSPSDSTAPSPSPSTSTAPSPSPSTDPSPSPSPSSGELIPSTQTADSFTMSGRGDITLDDGYKVYTFKITFVPEGSTGTITWESNRPDVISVDENGKVTALKKGSATVTATMAGGYTQSCIVRSTVTGGGTADTPSPQPSGSLTISRTDFTLSYAGDKWQLKVNGTTSTPEWSIGNTSVATISSDGIVTAVGPGTTTVTATVDGQTLECIVRCTW